VPFKSNLRLLAWANPSWRVWLDAKYDSTKFQKNNCLILSSDRKVMAVLSNHLWVRVSKVWYWLEWEIGWSNDNANFTENVWQGSGMERKAQTHFATYLWLATWRINTRRLAGQTDECIRSVCYWIGGIGWVAQLNARSGVLQTKNTNPSQQQDATMMNMNSTRRLTNENCGSKGYRTTESV
jgi:hypothetical protein